MIGKLGVKINTKAEVRGEDQPPNLQTCSIYESTSHLGFFSLRSFETQTVPRKRGADFCEGFC